MAPSPAGIPVRRGSGLARALSSPMGSDAWPSRRLGRLGTRSIVAEPGPRRSATVAVAPSLPAVRMGRCRRGSGFPPVPIKFARGGTVRRRLPACDRGPSERPAATVSAPAAARRRDRTGFGLSRRLAVRPARRGRVPAGWLERPCSGGPRGDCPAMWEASCHFRSGWVLANLVATVQSRMG